MSFLLNLKRKINPKDREKIKDIRSIPAKIQKLYNKYYNITYQLSSRLIKAFTS